MKKNVWLAKEIDIHKLMIVYAQMELLKISFLHNAQNVVINVVPVLHLNSIA